MQDLIECKTYRHARYKPKTKFFELLKDSNISLWDRCTNHSKLSVVTYVFTIKSNHGLSGVGYNTIIKWVRIILLEGNRLKRISMLLNP